MYCFLLPQWSCGILLFSDRHGPGIGQRRMTQQMYPLKQEGAIPLKWVRASTGRPARATDYWEHAVAIISRFSELIPWELA